VTDITIKDIARIAGVSVSTVSKALNDSTAVKPSTKLKIKQLSEQMGYRPNIAAKSLVSQRSRTIGAVWPNVNRAILSTLATKINEELNARGYSMLLSINPIESAVQLFNQIQVDAVLVFDRNDTAGLVSHLPSKAPILCYGEPSSRGFPSIYVDRRKAIYEAVQYLSNLGHKRIAYIGDLSNRRFSQQEKYLGFMDGIIGFGLPTHPNMAVNSNGLDSHEGYEAAMQLWESPYKPTAIIGGTYDLSLGITRALQWQNIKLPQDISLVSYDNIGQMSSLPVPMTSVGAPIDAIAAKVVESILVLIEKQEQLPAIQTIEPALVERNSCLPLTAE